MQAPPRARYFAITDIAAFDDEALRTFLNPRDGGVDAALLGSALQTSDPALCERARGSVPPEAREAFDSALARRVEASEVDSARRAVVEWLFWPLLYWNHPDEYEELIAGETLHPGLLDLMDLDGRVVCDIGAGTGRFTLSAARRAACVIAVDAVPALLERLEHKLRALKIGNVELRRGGFGSLPLSDTSVDVAVACSSLTPHGPQGGEHLFIEAERVVRSGGALAVVWPQEPAWFEARGFTYHALSGNNAVAFPDVVTAERICRLFYSGAAAAWVRAHGTSRVPYTVLGMTPPNDLCIKRVSR